MYVDLRHLNCMQRLRVGTQVRTTLRYAQKSTPSLVFQWSHVAEI